MNMFVANEEYSEGQNAMSKIGIISYNRYCNFTNYGSALQSWALHRSIQHLDSNITPVFVDYCPDVHIDKDPLNPGKAMWDQDEESKRMLELTLPAIRENFYKFEDFYINRFEHTKQKYTSLNFSEISDENLDGFICGSDTIFCIDEFKGFDDGYYANFPEMKGKSVSYAASFGDSHFSEEDYFTLNDRLRNFRALGIRENQMVSYVTEHTKAPVMRTIDPTLLLKDSDYDSIAEERIIKEPYLLLYARRYNGKMESYAERLAKENGCKIVEISLRATNAEKGHRMFYEAGVEEFLSLVKYAEYVVTNSFHGLIFSVQYKRPFVVFSREQCDTKIEELLTLLGLEDHLLVSGHEPFSDINYKLVHERIDQARNESLAFLNKELGILKE